MSPCSVHCRYLQDSRHEDVSSLDSEAVEISTQDDLIRLLLKGGTIDLRDKEIMLDRFGGTYKPIPPKEFTAALVARKSVTISNGTLSCHGPVFALVARGGAVVHLKNIKIYGAGLGAGDQGTELIVESCEIARAAEHCGAVCTDSGSICLLQSDISECEVAGVLSAGAGSRVSMTGGAIRSSLTSHGAASQAGAWLRLEGVRVIDSQRVGVAVTGEGSVVEISDCLISGSKVSACHADSQPRFVGATAATGIPYINPPRPRLPADLSRSCLPERRNDHHAQRRRGGLQGRWGPCARRRIAR